MNNREKDKNCVICEAEGYEKEAARELDIGFGPAPVCQKHYDEHKNDNYNNIELDEHL